MKIEVNLTEIRIRPDLARSAIVALLAALPTDEAELALLEWSTLQDLHTRLQQQGADLPLFVGPLAAGRTLPQPGGGDQRQDRRSLRRQGRRRRIRTS